MPCTLHKNHKSKLKWIHTDFVNGFCHIVDDLGHLVNIRNGNLVSLHPLLFQIQLL
ncbi:hypothetical protein THIOM_005426 [Candidatus Thiomargarita nelsonii]|uniref:Uncharacterized protein n=1 Tax=Candidatus Thiomargarita nelsonii TaxID=1003181 RepID=A0A176RTA7_9GAMM|nr:hypothetical protein THIOM_005426 [Candidatus Thiomargarita nelsonii]